jgi:hypothetical protein
VFVVTRPIRVDLTCRLLRVMPDSYTSLDCEGHSSYNWEKTVDGYCGAVDIPMMSEQG